MKDDVQRIRSGAYHKYFEGYAETQYYDEKGNVHTDRVYVGRFYRRDVTDKVNVITKIAYTLVFLAAAVLWILAGTRDTASDSEWFVVLPAGLSLIAMIGMLIPLYYNLTAKRKMIVRVYYDSHVNLYHLAYVAAALQYINAVVSLACREVFCFAMYFLSALLLTAIAFYESRTRYEVIPAEKKAPSGSTIIQYRSNF